GVRQRKNVAVLVAAAPQVVELAAEPVDMEDRLAALPVAGQGELFAIAGQAGLGEIRRAMKGGAVYTVFKEPDLGMKERVAHHGNLQDKALLGDEPCEAFKRVAYQDVLVRHVFDKDFL